MTITAEGKHFPAIADKFVFDEEVASLFPTMAQRSIPSFTEAHTMHARMLAPLLTARAEEAQQVNQRTAQLLGHEPLIPVYCPVTVLDVGASRGAFLDALQETYGKEQVAKRISYTAIDGSRPMCKALRASQGNEINVLHVDITSDVFLESNPYLYDVVNMTYVLQFIPPEMQFPVFLKIASLVKKGGVLLLGQKEELDTEIGRQLHEQYLHFRIEHGGYTREEIEAKTEALRNSMWPMTRQLLGDWLHDTGFQFEYTTRHTVFSTLFAVKKGG